MAQNIYVGQLSYDTTEDSLRDLFSQAGTVLSVTIIKDRMSGKSKGFGFVEMEEGNTAIEMFNGKDFEGRKIIVNEARPREERPPRRGGGVFHKGGRSFDREQRKSW